MHDNAEKKKEKKRKKKRGPIVEEEKEKNKVGYLVPQQTLSFFLGLIKSLKR